MTITLDIDGDTYNLRRMPAYTEVGRVGSAPFCQAYEDPAEAHPVDAFVVLDDHGDCEVDGHTVRTDTRFGLSDEDVARAVRILGER